MRCPVCRADNDLVASCRRCKADLELLLAVETQRQQALTAANRALQAGELSVALRAAAQAHHRRAAADTARLLAVAHLRSGNFALALRWRQAAVLPTE
jgi:Flp pilus assembly protein CpaB